MLHDQQKMYTIIQSTLILMFQITFKIWTQHFKIIVKNSQILQKWFLETLAFLRLLREKYSLKGL